MQSNFTTETSPKVQSSKSLNTHEIECKCDLSNHNFLKRSYLKFSSLPKTQSCWRAKKWAESCSVPSNSRQAYEELLEIAFDSEEISTSLKQIELDLRRTYPDDPYFTSLNGTEALRRCLIAFSKYDHKLGYVQGMNFIMAALLWHSTEFDAFWIFVGLMEDFELRDTYLPRLPGLSKHCEIIELLTLEFLPDLHSHLARFRVSSEMYATEWCFTLFGSVVPADEIHFILDPFFERGWIFFYRFVIVLLECLERKLLEAEDPIEVLLSLKIYEHSESDWENFMERLGPRLNWRVLNERVSSLELDENSIKYLHMCFNCDTGQFDMRKSFRKE